MHFPNGLCHQKPRLQIVYSPWPSVAARGRGRPWAPVPSVAACGRGWPWPPVAARWSYVGKTGQLFKVQLGCRVVVQGY